MKQLGMWQEVISLEVPGAPARILMADDNLDHVATTAMLLHTEGFTVRGFGSGKALLDQFGQYRPDVVILDLGMPGMTAYDVARAMRDAKRWREFLLIALTGYGTMTDQFLTRMAGFDYHLTKPVDPHALTALIRDYVSGRPQAANNP